jgi:hypothetical protein
VLSLNGLGVVEHLAFPASAWLGLVVVILFAEWFTQFSGEISVLPYTPERILEMLSKGLPQGVVGRVLVLPVILLIGVVAAVVLSSAANMVFVVMIGAFAALLAVVLGLRRVLS